MTSRIGKKIGVILYILAFLYSAVPAFFLTAPPVEDALGTMGTAAYLAGYDWSEFLVEKGFYYKYGQTVFYLPVFLLIRDPAMRYKVLLATGSALTAFVPVLVYGVAVRWLRSIYYKNEDGDRDKAFFLAICCGFMPSIMLYGKYTWAESVLFVIPWVVMLIMMELLECARSERREDENGGKGLSGKPKGTNASGICDKQLSKKKILSAALAWASVYAFMCHQRGVVIVIAVAMTLVIMRLVYRTRLVSFWTYLINLVFSLGLDRLFNSLERQYVFRGVTPRYNLLGRFLEPETYIKLFSAKGQVVLWRTIAGWLYNVAVSGMGFALMGIVVCLAAGVLGAVRYFGKRNGHCEAATRTIVYVLGYLMHLGAFALGVMFFFLDLYEYWEGNKVMRCDHLVFGRYLESTLPVMMFVGVMFLITKADCTREGRIADGSLNIPGAGKLESAYAGGTMRGGFAPASRSVLAAATALFLLLMLEFGLRIAPAMEGVDSYVHSLMSMNLCFNLDGVTQTRDYIVNLPGALMIAGFVAIVLFLLVSMLIRAGKYRWALSIIVVVFAYIYLRSFIDIVYRVDVCAATDYARYYLGK